MTLSTFLHTKRLDAIFPVNTFTAGSTTIYLDLVKLG